MVHEGIQHVLELFHFLGLESDGTHYSSVEVKVLALKSKHSEASGVAVVAIPESLGLTASSIKL